MPNQPIKGEKEIFTYNVCERRNETYQGEKPPKRWECSYEHKRQFLLCAKGMMGVMELYMVAMESEGLIHQHSP